MAMQNGEIPNKDSKRYNQPGAHMKLHFERNPEKAKAKQD